MERCQYNPMRHAVLQTWIKDIHSVSTKIDAIFGRILESTPMDVEAEMLGMCAQMRDRKPCRMEHRFDTIQTLSLIDGCKTSHQFCRNFDCRPSWKILLKRAEIL